MYIYRRLSNTYKRATLPNGARGIQESLFGQHELAIGLQGLYRALIDCLWAQKYIILTPDTRRVHGGRPLAI